MSRSRKAGLAPPDAFVFATLETMSVSEYA